MTTLVGILCGDKIWKRVFSYTLTLVLFGIFFVCNITDVLAANVPPQIQNGSNINYNPPNSSGSPDDRGTLPNIPGGGVSGGGATGQSPAQASAQLADERLTAEQAAAQAAAIAASENTGSTPDGVLGLFHTYVLTGVGWVVGQAGNAFDYAISEYVVGFGNLYINKNVGRVIDDLWQTVRDIFNLTFIFGLVYIGFKMILDSSDSNARKMLISLIGAALLVNFSLFITKFVVDFSNIAAAQVYNTFASSGALSITNGFMTMLGVQSLIGVQYTTGGSFAYIIGMLIIFAILAYVFLAGAIMLIIRFVVLNIYMVFSPFMFLGWVFPAMSSYSKDYWSGFLRQAFFAPAFLFMLYLAYRVSSSIAFDRQSLGHVFNPNGQSAAEAVDSMGVIPYFAMVIVFLCASMVVAKKMGASGASFAMSTSGKIVGGATVGLAARAGRTTLGAGAYKLSQNDTFRDVTSRFGRAGKSVYQATSSVADSSFDARKVGGVGKKLGIGEGAKGGFATNVKKQKESDEKFLKDIGTRDADSFDPATKAAKADYEKWEEIADQETNIFKKSEYADNAKRAKASYDIVKRNYSAREEYRRQLSYAKAIESWQKTQVVLTSVTGGAIAGVLTGGLAPAAVGLVGGAGLGINNYNINKQSAKAVRKEFGKNGLKKRKSSHEEHALKKAMAALGDDHGHAEKPQAGAVAGTVAAKPAATSKPAPAASSAPAPAADNHGH